MCQKTEISHLSQTNNDDKWTAEEACNLYWKYYHHSTNGFYPRRIKNFDKHRKRVTTWIVFEKLAILANRHKINLTDYISLIASKQKASGGYFTPKTLIHPTNLQIWSEKIASARQTEAQEKLLKIFMNSVRFIIKFCIDNNIKTLKEYLEVSMKTGTLNVHVASGKLSKYVLSLMPTKLLTMMKQRLEPDVAYQLNEMTIKNKDALCSNTITALRELHGIKVSSTKYIFDLIDKNIAKNS